MALADVNTAVIQAVVEKLVTAGHRALALSCDVSDEDQVAAAGADTVSTLGGLDLAFNNAGIQIPFAGSADEDGVDFDRVSSIDQRGIWAAMKHELRHMSGQGHGAIVNCSSIGGLHRRPGPGCVSRLQARRHRADQERRQRVRAARDPDECRVAGHHRHPHGQRHDRRRQFEP